MVEVECMTHAKQELINIIIYYLSALAALRYILTLEIKTILTSES